MLSEVKWVSKPGLELALTAISENSMKQKSDSSRLLVLLTLSFKNTFFFFAFLIVNIVLYTNANEGVVFYFTKGF